MKDKTVTDKNNDTRIIQEAQRQESNLASNSFLQQPGMDGIMNIIMAIMQLLGFGDMGGAFKGSLQNVSKMSFEELSSHPTFQSSLPKTFELNQEDLNFVTPESLMADPETRDAIVDATVRTAVSIGIESYVENAIARGVSYKMGAKGNGSKVDCSGFVSNAIKTAMNGVKDGVSIDAEDVSINVHFSDAVSKATLNHSDGQITGLGREAGIMRGKDVNLSSIREGTVIGIDSGDKGWDRGRNLGVDHVGIVYRDTESGKMMFAESASSKGGAHATPLNEWLEKNEHKKLYAVDIVKLAKVDYERKQQQAPELQQAKAETDNTLTEKAGIKPEATPNMV